MSPRRSSDGSYYLIRRDRRLEDELDQTHTRVIGERKWYPRYETRSIQEVFDICKGQVVNIVGKGPSLDNLTNEDLGLRPTFALNEAIHVVSELTSRVFCVTQDGALRDTCRPKFGGLICNLRVASWYAGYRFLYVVQPLNFGKSQSCLSASLALMLAERGGAEGANMLCFDGCVNGNFQYAKAIGHPSSLGGRPSRFSNHRAEIESATKLPLNWTLPVHKSVGVNETLP